MNKARSPRFVLPLAFVALLAVGFQQQEEGALVLEAEGQTFEWVRDWAQLPEGMTLGNTHGCIVVDSKDRVYVNTDTEHAVIVFGPDGKYLRSFGKELARGLHGMTLVREGDEEFLYMAHTGRQEVLKTTLEGEILWTLGIPEAPEIYPDPGRYRPTSVAVAPDGGLFVADGYGTSWIHRYDAERNYLGSFGGPGQELGQLRTPHGLYLEEEHGEPHLLVADRENNRLQRFDLEGKPLGEIKGDLRRPCHVHGFEKTLLVADLAGRITLLDREGNLVGHLGDNPDPALRANNGVPVTAWKPGEFLAPHCANWDSAGNIYVMDWVSVGRITKLARR